MTLLLKIELLELNESGEKAPSLERSEELHRELVGEDDCFKEKSWLEKLEGFFLFS